MKHEELRDTLTKAIGKAYQLGQIYWQQADSEFSSMHKKADITDAKFKVLQAESNDAILALLDELEAARKDLLDANLHIKQLERGFDKAMEAK